MDLINCYLGEIMKILVKSDTYNICNRIKKFDASYVVVYNNVANKFEIYSTNLTQVVELLKRKCTYIT